MSVSHDLARGTGLLRESPREIARAARDVEHL